MFFSFVFCTFFKIFHVHLGKKVKVLFSRVYVWVTAKLTLVNFFYFFFHAPSPQHVDYCHPRVSGAAGRLHQLLLHLCDSCCAGCLKDICSCLVASSDHDYRASVRELPIPPWTHIFQDGFQVASEAGSTQHTIKPRLLYFYDISDSLLLYFSAALQEQFWHCLLVGFS